MCNACSVSRQFYVVGDCTENTRCERFFAALEFELLERRRFRTKIETRMAVFSFIETRDKPHRPHSGLDDHVIHVVEYLQNLIHTEIEDEFLKYTLFPERGKS